MKRKIIPMMDFFKNPKKIYFELSPNGEYLSFCMPWKNLLNIYIQNIGKNELKRITNETERNIAGYIWANDNRIVFIKDKDGDENFRAFAVNIDGSNFKELIPFENVQVRLIDALKNNPDHILIGLNKRDKQIFDVYRININTGEMKMITKNPGNITGWLTDHEGYLRVATSTDGVNTNLLYRKKESDNFKTVITTSFKETIEPLFFTFDNKYLYVTSNIGRDKQAIFKYDIANGKFIKEIYNHPEVDVCIIRRKTASHSDL